MSMIIITVDQFGQAYCIYNSSRYFKQKESPFEMIIALKNLMPKLSCKLKVTLYNLKVRKQISPPRNPFSDFAFDWEIQI